MDMEHVRVVAHFSWFAWFTALFFLAHAADGKRIHITHTYVGRASIALMATWFVLLMLTVRGVELIPREMVVPTLTSLELGGGVLAWTWLVWCGSNNFRFEFRRDGKTPMLLIALLTVIFLG